VAEHKRRFDFFMRRLFIPLVTALPLALFGCSSVDHDWVKTSLQDSFKECGGQVTDVTLVKEGMLSNKHDGYATVKIAGKEYYPDVTVFADGNATFYRNQDACALHEAQQAGQEMEQSLKNLSNF